MGDKHSGYSNKFDFFANSSLSMLSVALAIYAIYLTGGIAMTQQLPLVVLAMFVVAGLAFLLAIYNGIRMITTPKDNRIDTLIERFNRLEMKIDSLAERLPDKATIERLTIAVENLTKTLKG